MRDRIIAGSRRSKLALIQTASIISKIRVINLNLEVSVREIVTSGDRDRHTQLDRLGTAVFVKELEEALLENRVDLVVHSLKDLPTELPVGLKLACVIDRCDPRDVLVSAKYETLAKLPPGATVATSSRRRSAQLLALRPDLSFVDMRGNIPTRLRKLEEGQCDAMILAAAGLVRLDLGAKIKEYLPVAVSTPAVGQGALAVECRTADSDLCGMLSEIEDPDIAQEVEAERAFLDELGSGCSVPAGALGRIDGDSLTLHGCVAALDGSQILRDRVTGHKQNAFHLGKALAHKMLAAGAEKILTDLRRSTPNAVSPP